MWRKAMGYGAFPLGLQLVQPYNLTQPYTTLHTGVTELKNILAYLLQYTDLLHVTQNTDKTARRRKTAVCKVCNLFSLKLTRENVFMFYQSENVL